MKKKPKAKAPPRAPCVIICFATKVRERAEKAKRVELAQRRQASFAGSILEGELQ